MSLYPRNDALRLDPPTGVDEHITVRGSDWYWAVTAAMASSCFIMTGMMYKKPRGERIFHYITIAIVATASIAYYSMGADLGWAPINVEYIRNERIVAGRNRQIFYVRYIDWFLTTPLLLLDIMLTAGVQWSTIFFTLFLDIVMIVTGLVGALTATRYKWGYYTAGCFAYLMILYQILVVGRANAKRIGDDVHKVFMSVAGLTILLWTLYPIAWGLCEGGNVISSDSEAIFYGVLDIIAKIGFGFLLLFGHRNIDLTRLGFNGADRVFTDEKHMSPASTVHGHNTGVLNNRAVNNGETVDTTHTV